MIRGIVRLRSHGQRGKRTLPPKETELVRDMDKRMLKEDYVDMMSQMKYVVASTGYKHDNALNDELKRKVSALSAAVRANTDLGHISGEFVKFAQFSRSLTRVEMLSLQSNAVVSETLTKLHKHARSLTPADLSVLVGFCASSSNGAGKRLGASFLRTLLTSAPTAVGPALDALKGILEAQTNSVATETDGDIWRVVLETIEVETANPYFIDTASTCRLISILSLPQVSPAISPVVAVRTLEKVVDCIGYQATPLELVILLRGLVNLCAVRIPKLPHQQITKDLAEVQGESVPYISPSTPPMINQPVLKIDLDANHVHDTVQISNVENGVSALPNDDHGDFLVGANQNAMAAFAPLDEGQLTIVSLPVSAPLEDPATTQMRTQLIADVERVALKLVSHMDATNKFAPVSECDTIMASLALMKSALNAAGSPASEIYFSPTGMRLLRSCSKRSVLAWPDQPLQKLVAPLSVFAELGVRSTAGYGWVQELCTRGAVRHLEPHQLLTFLTAAEKCGLGGVEDWRDDVMRVITKLVHGEDKGKHMLESKKVDTRDLTSLMVHAAKYYQGKSPIHRKAVRGLASNISQNLMLEGANSKVSLRDAIFATVHAVKLLPPRDDRAKSLLHSTINSILLPRLTETEKQFAHVNASNSSQNSKSDAAALHVLLPSEAARLFHACAQAGEVDQALALSRRVLAPMAETCIGTGDEFAPRRLRPHWFAEVLHSAATLRLPPTDPLISNLLVAADEQELFNKLNPQLALSTLWGLTSLHDTSPHAYHALEVHGEALVGKVAKLDIGDMDRRLQQRLYETLLHLRTSNTVPANVRELATSMVRTLHVLPATNVPSLIPGVPNEALAPVANPTLELTPSAAPVGLSALDIEAFLDGKVEDTDELPTRKGRRRAGGEAASEKAMVDRMLAVLGTSSKEVEVDIIKNLNEVEVDGISEKDVQVEASEALPPKSPAGMEAVATHTKSKSELVASFSRQTSPAVAGGRKKRRGGKGDAPDAHVEPVKETPPAGDPLSLQTNLLSRIDGARGDAVLPNGIPVPAALLATGVESQLQALQLSWLRSRTRAGQLTPTTLTVGHILGSLNICMDVLWKYGGDGKSISHAERRDMGGFAVGVSTDGEYTVDLGHEAIKVGVVIVPEQHIISSTEPETGAVSVSLSGHMHMRVSHLRRQGWRLVLLDGRSVEQLLKSQETPGAHWRPTLDDNDAETDPANPPVSPLVDVDRAVVDANKKVPVDPKFASMSPAEAQMSAFAHIGGQLLSVLPPVPGAGQWASGVMQDWMEAVWLTRGGSD